MGRRKVPSAKIELVTPQMARKLLNGNTANRNLTLNKYKKLVRDIKNGDGVLTTDGIGVDVNGVIVNGQNRLKAIIESGVSMQLIVARNLDPKARDMVDTGTPRSFKQSLEMNNLCCKRDANGQIISRGNLSNIISSSASYMILHQTGKFKKISGVGSELSNSEVVEFVRSNEAELMETANFVISESKSVKYVQKAHLHTIYQMNKLYNKPKAQEFVKVVCGNSVSSNPKTCPAHILKNKLIEDKAKSKNRLKTKDLMGLYIDASNKYMKNLGVKSIRSKAMKDEPNYIKPVGRITNEAKEFFNTINYELHKPKAVGRPKVNKD